ncbi:MAG: hypothetical protein JSW14_04975 [Candidatus Bathyarchaeum sp.]|nr:MAG: hypothetical protein JSW14_04975 [Candidatus Bathyarchaeum sp.]
MTVFVVDSGDDYQFNNGTTVDIFVAEDSDYPVIPGDWGVQAFFQGADGKTKAGLEDVISTKARSFFTIPEIPVGTIGAVAAMAIAFGLFAIRKKKTAVGNK